MVAKGFTTSIHVSTAAPVHNSASPAAAGTVTGNANTQGQLHATKQATLYGWDCQKGLQKDARQAHIRQHAPATA